MNWPTPQTERLCRRAVLLLGLLWPVLVFYGATR